MLGLLVATTLAYCNLSSKPSKLYAHYRALLEGNQQAQQQASEQSDAPVQQMPQQTAQMQQPMPQQQTFEQARQQSEFPKTDTPDNDAEMDEFIPITPVDNRKEEYKFKGFQI